MDFFDAYIRVYICRLYGSSIQFLMFFGPKSHYSVISPWGTFSLLVAKSHPECFGNICDLPPFRAKLNIWTFKLCCLVTVTQEHQLFRVFDSLSFEDEETNRFESGINTTGEFSEEQSKELMLLSLGCL